MSLWEKAKEYARKPVELYNQLDEKNILDAPAPAAYLRSMLENLNPFDPSTLTEWALPEAEALALRDIVTEQVKKGKSGLSYSDFVPQSEAQPLGYKVKTPSLKDPRESLRLLLGRADITKDEDGNIYVEDVFDFNAPEEEKNASLLNRLQMGYDALTSDMSTYGKVHRIGELFAEPVPVKINIGNAAELGITEKELAKISSERQSKDKDPMDVLNTIDEGIDSIADFFKTGFESTIK